MQRVQDHVSHQESTDSTCLWPTEGEGCQAPKKVVRKVVVVVILVILVVLVVLLVLVILLDSQKQKDQICTDTHARSDNNIHRKSGRRTRNVERTWQLRNTTSAVCF